MYGTLVSVENTMDREHIKGAADKAKGDIKETAGKMTGDEKLRAEGKLDRAKGAAQKVAGDMKEATHQRPREPMQQSPREAAHQTPREAPHHNPRETPHQGPRETPHHGPAHHGPKNTHE
jgi:uncharacterized protein YjbJ (UPF0337 family)